MKYLILSALAGAALAINADIMCATITKEVINPACTAEAARCGASMANCALVTTLTNQCGCPAAIPTATLMQPCNAACPFAGCSVEYRSTQVACGGGAPAAPSPPPALPMPPPPAPSPSAPAASTPRPASSAPVATAPPAPVVTRPPPAASSPTAVNCPTVTKTTTPADCPALRCPVPNCIYQETLAVPCGCSGPKTVLYVSGCAASCPQGCATTTNTVQQPCPSPIF